MQVLRVEDRSAVAAARRAIEALASRCGLDQEATSRAALVAVELGTNLVKHAGGGTLLLGPSVATDEPCIDLIAMDSGEGIADLETALSDGFSTAGSGGTGLGAVRRQASFLDVVSWPGRGTVILARIHKRSGMRPEVDLPWGALCLAKAGEEVCGDGFAVRGAGRSLHLLLCDGLGHGAAAAQASQEAIRLFRANSTPEPEAMVQTLHLGLRPTRGAAVAVASIDLEARLLAYSGIGNIAATLVGSAGFRKLVSHNGTAGLVARHIHAFQYSYGPETLLVMHSDGLGSSWALDRYPGLSSHDPMLIAGVLCRDYRKERDDATVLVARLP